MDAPISKLRRARGSGVFEVLLEQAISYQMKPGERLSEIDLAQRLEDARAAFAPQLGDRCDGDGRHHRATACLVHAFKYTEMRS